MIQHTTYKDRPAIALDAGGSRALFLPDDGGKLASLTFCGREMLAQRKGDVYRRLLVDSSYVEAECSAFDDMFPTIDPCEIDGHRYLDHGEVCRRAWVSEIDGDRLSLCCTLREVEATLTKTASLTEDGALLLHYRMENRAARPLPCLWAGHIMLAGEEGAYVESPYSVTDDVSIAFGQPLSRESAHVLPPRGATGEYKFYYDAPRSPMDCTVVYPSGGRLRFRFEGDVVRYLALWFNPGVLNGMYNLAVEPCCAPYDDPLRAAAANKGFTLPPHGTAEFTLTIRYSR